jgi:hypothetical protein
MASVPRWQSAASLAHPPTSIKSRIASWWPMTTVMRRNPCRFSFSLPGTHEDGAIVAVAIVLVGLLPVWLLNRVVEYRP